MKAETITSPIIPIRAMSAFEDKTAQITAKSIAGSSTLIPPAILINTSLSLHRIHYDFHLRFPNVLRICLRYMFAGFDKFISIKSGCEGILLL